jgi:aspartyl-tRNA(Asn)/glutamyl-tRNA(Gln) amidotransferase subunit A
MKKGLIAISLFVMLMLAVLVIKSNINNEPSFVLEEATIESTHAAIKQRQITCEQLVSAYIARIKEYNLRKQKKFI